MKAQQIETETEDIRDYQQECKKHFEKLLHFAESNESAESKDFEKFEGSLFTQLLQLGTLLTQLYFKKKEGISVKK